MRYNGYRNIDNKGTRDFQRKYGPSMKQIEEFKRQDEN